MPEEGLEEAARAHGCSTLCTTVHLGDTAFYNSKGKVRESPTLEAAVADTHAHLDMLASPGLALARAAYHNVDFINCIADPSENVDCYRLLDAWLTVAQVQLDTWADEADAGAQTPSGVLLEDLTVPRVRLMPGVHPHNAKEWGDELRATMHELIADPRTCGIGEIGLDYHYDLSPRDVQQQVFAEELALACELDIPVALHLREAHADALEIIRQVGLPRAGCILHCCNLDVDALNPFLELGCYIAYGGPLTFKKADEVRDALPLVPLDRLLTETDSPYMTPEPCRGTECGPANTIYTADMLAAVYTAAHTELTRVQVLEAAHGNALALLAGRSRLDADDEHAALASAGVDGGRPAFAACRTDGERQ